MQNSPSSPSNPGPLLTGYSFPPQSPKQPGPTANLPLHLTQKPELIPAPFCASPHPWTFLRHPFQARASLLGSISFCSQTDFTAHPAFITGPFFGCPPFHWFAVFSRISISSPVSFFSLLFILSACCFYHLLLFRLHQFSPALTSVTSALFPANVCFGTLPSRPFPVCCPSLCLVLLTDFSGLPTKAPLPPVRFFGSRIPTIFSRVFLMVAPGTNA